MTVDQPFWGRIHNAWPVHFETDVNAGPEAAHELENGYHGLAHAARQQGAHAVVGMRIVNHSHLATYILYGTAVTLS
jgi:hypothetical protein